MAGVGEINGRILNSIKVRVLDTLRSSNAYQSTMEKQDDTSSVASTDPSTQSLSTAASYRRKHGVSLLARAFLFEVDAVYNWTPPAPSAKLAEILTYACGQIELKVSDEGAEEDDDGEEVKLVFKGYVEFSIQVTPVRIREWLQVTDESDFKISPVYIKDRERLIKLRTSSETRYKGPDDLILPAAWGRGESSRAAPGARSDMEEIRELLREHGPEAGVKKVAEQFPGQFVRYANGITQLAQLVVPRVREEESFVFRPWQAAIHKIASGKPHDRHIYWIEDGKGNTGKSRLTTWMCREMGAVELDGRQMDAAFSYTGQPIVIFDLARCVDTATLKDMYTVAEKLKNGQIYSSKYMSRLKVFHVPHVFFFSNSPPPIGVWSADRLQHIVLTPADGFHAGSQVLEEIPEIVPATGLDLFNKYLEQETEARKKKAEDDAALAQQARDNAEDAAEVAAYKADKEKRAAELKVQMEKNRKRKIEQATAGSEGGDS